MGYPEGTYGAEIVNIGITQIQKGVLADVKELIRARAELDHYGIPQGAAIRRNGDFYIAAIKMVRQETGVGLREAKAFVDFVDGLLKEQMIRG